MSEYPKTLTAFLSETKVSKKGIEMKWEHFIIIVEIIISYNLIIVWMSIRQYFLESSFSCGTGYS